MELRPSRLGQKPNSNKNRNLAFGSPIVSEMLLLSFPSLPPGLFQQPKKDFIQRELIGSPTNRKEDASAAPPRREGGVAGIFGSGAQLSLLAGSALLLESV